MSDVRRALAQHFNDESSISSLVTGGVHHIGAPQNTAAPYIVLRCISEVPTHVFSGSSGVSVQRWQVSIHALASTGTYSIKEAIRLHMLSNNGRSTIGSGSYTASVLSVRFDNAVTSLIRPEGGGSIPIEVTDIDLLIWAVEATS